MLECGGNRQQERHARALERRAWKTGYWGAWQMTSLPRGPAGAIGWLRDVRLVHVNDLYAVLERPVETRWGEVRHLAIRTASNLEPPWRDKQRIKNELFGVDAIALEVMPAMDELVDEADMYHIWVMPAGFEMPFTLKGERRTPAQGDER